MSSVRSAFAQVNPREKFLLCVSHTQNVVHNGSVGKLSALMTDADFNTATGAALTGAAIPALGDLYLDLGVTVTTYDPATNMHIAKYVLAEKMDNAASEGRSGVFRYILVWAADASKDVGFVRTG